MIRNVMRADSIPYQLAGSSSLELGSKHYTVKKGCYRNTLRGVRTPV